MDSSVSVKTNTSMKNPELNLGVLVPPNKIEKPVLYSEKEARTQFNQLTKDIYSKQKHYDFEDNKTTPKLIKIGAILTTLGALGVFIFSKIKK